MRQRHDPAGAGVWLEADPDTVEEHLALDEALLEEACGGTGPTVVRTWMAREPVVVVGSSSRVEEEVDLAACRAASIGIVRRPTGGLTVLLGPGCLMWSVVERLPEATPPIATLHARMLDPLCAALSRRLPGAAGVTRRGSSDLVVEKGGLLRKVSGNALKIRRQAVLYHGTLLDEFDLDLVGRVLRHPPREPDYRDRRPHGAFLWNLRLGRDALEAAVREAFAPACSRTAWPRERVAELVAQRYARPEWTARM